MFEILDDDGAVINVIASDLAFVEQHYPGKYREIVAIEPATGSDHGTIITRAAFRSRFTQAEKIAIELAGLDDPSAAMEARSQAAAIRTYQKDVDAAEFIDLTDPATAGGVQALEAAGLLAEGRAADILTAPVQWSELPSSVQQSLPA
ncbi:hypothetical protein [Stutzerimonas frequens]|uniref:Uncharacterized protein n=1 Tax=Stutzerimonas frequens TaxID=2968969 RepID=A0AA47HZZ5_9GAMM|nr:hypothetical protein [Stutzerimonas frequens]WAE53231.1 hypothetical protein OSV15_03260 [Stutzerimonas frequens]